MTHREFVEGETESNEAVYY